MDKRLLIHTSVVALVLAGLVSAVRIFSTNEVVTADTEPLPAEEPAPTLDTAAYDRKLRFLAHLPPFDELTVVENGTPSTPPPWPVTDNPYPNYGALLPFNRIVAYYGNFYSTGMGILGQYRPDEVLRRLRADVEKWKAADPATPVVPAIDYIAVTAQLSPGADRMYRFRMPDTQIQKAIDLAKQVDGIVILEVQSALAPLQGEIERLEPFLKLPQVHLAIDPEFAMRPSGRRPGTVVGTVDAKDVNAAAEYLAKLVREHHLPPKVLVVHRYTRAMVTNADNIAPLPEVQVVMDMDGWGPPSQKIATYQAYIQAYPVQFTGFKLFYRNDIRRAGSRMMTPEEILKLMPSPSFIQYQ